MKEWACDTVICRAYSPLHHFHSTIEIAPKSIINIYYYKSTTWIENYFDSGCCEIEPNFNAFYRSRHIHCMWMYLIFENVFQCNNSIDLKWYNFVPNKYLLDKSIFIVHLLKNDHIFLLHVFYKNITHNLNDLLNHKIYVENWKSNITIIICCNIFIT